MIIVNQGTFQSFMVIPRSCPSYVGNNVTVGLTNLARDLRTLPRTTTTVVARRQSIASHFAEEFPSDFYRYTLGCTGFSYIPSKKTGPSKTTACIHVVTFFSHRSKESSYISAVFMTSKGENCCVCCINIS